MDIVHRWRPQPSRAEQAVSALTQIMRDAESNRALLLAYVLGGKRKFLIEVRRELRGMAITDDMLEKVWIWMFFRRGPDDPKAEYEALCEQAYARKLMQEAEQSKLTDLYEKARGKVN